MARDTRRTNTLRTSAAATAAADMTAGGNNTSPTVSTATGPPPDGTAAPTEAEMDMLLFACGINEADQQKCLREEQGLQHFANWLDVDSDDFTSVARTTSKLPTNPFLISVVTRKRLVALWTWIQDAVLMGGTMDEMNPSDFSVKVMRDCVQIS